MQSNTIVFCHEDLFIILMNMLTNQQLKMKIDSPEVPYFTSTYNGVLITSKRNYYIVHKHSRSSTKSHTINLHTRHSFQESFYSIPIQVVSTTLREGKVGLVNKNSRKPLGTSHMHCSRNNEQQPNENVFDLETQDINQFLQKFLGFLCKKVTKKILQILHQCPTSHKQKICLQRDNIAFINDDLDSQNP